jgi:hypothetical protein
LKSKRNKAKNTPTVGKFDRHRKNYENRQTQRVQVCSLGSGKVIDPGQDGVWSNNLGGI